jgi:hypothetical protein
VLAYKMLSLHHFKPPSLFLPPALAPAIDTVTPVERPGTLESLMHLHNPAQQPPLGSPTGTYRRTRQSKHIGDRAEEEQLLGNLR